MSGFRESLIVNTATIPSGQTTSNAIDLGVSVLCSISVPAAMTGTAVIFEVSLDGVTYQELYDPDLAASLGFTFTVAKNYPLSIEVFRGFRYVRVVSDATEASARAFGFGSRIVT